MLRAHSTCCGSCYLPVAQCRQICSKVHLRPPFVCNCNRLKLASGWVGRRRRFFDRRSRSCHDLSRLPVIWILKELLTHSNAIKDRQQLANPEITSQTRARHLLGVPVSVIRASLIPIPLCSVTIISIELCKRITSTVSCDSDFFALHVGDRSL